MFILRKSVNSYSVNLFSNRNMNSANDFPCDTYCVSTSGLMLSYLSIVFVVKDFSFNPSASPFLPTTCSSLSTNRLTETPAMAAQFPYLQPSWSQAEFSQSNWSNVYQHEPPLPYQHYDSTAYYGAEEVDARNAGFNQPGNVSCPVDWYSDNTGNFQALQSLPSFQVIVCPV